MIFISIFSKGHNSLIINVGGDMVLVPCTSSDHACIRAKFHENILKGFRVSIIQIFRGE